MTKIMCGKDKMHFEDVLLGISFVIPIFSRVANSSSFHISDIILYGIFFLITGLVCLVHIRSVKELLLFICLAGLGALMYFCAHTAIMLVLVMFCFCCRRKTYRKVANICFYSSLTLFILLVLAFLIFGYNSENNLIPTWDSNRGIRYSLGFNHPNTAAAYFFFVLTAFYMGHNLKLSNFIFTAPICFIIYLLTNSRTNFFIIIIFYLTLFVCQFSKKLFYKWFYYIAVLMFTLMTGLSFFMGKELSSTSLDSVLSGRLSLIYQALEIQSFSFFYSRVALPILDNMYVFSWVNKGFIFYFAINLFSTLGIVRAKKRLLKDDLAKFVAVYLVMMVFSFAEAQYVYDLIPVNVMCMFMCVRKTKEIPLQAVAGLAGVLPDEVTQSLFD